MRASPPPFACRSLVSAVSNGLRVAHPRPGNLVFSRTDLLEFRIDPVNGDQDVMKVLGA